MLFRCGYTRSHWGVDDMSPILYAKGAPLSPAHADQYSGSHAQQIGPMFNQCRLVDATKEPRFARFQTDVQDYGFGANADYALGRMYFSGEELGDGKGEMDWRRHILFLKSSQAAGPNYFVMRDTFTGYDGASTTNTGRTAWWHWLTLDTADLTKVNRTAFNAAQVADETVVPESQWPALTGNVIEMGTKYGASTWFWFDTPTNPTLKATMKMDYTVVPADYQVSYDQLLPPIPQAGSPESRTVYRMQGNADSGFFYVAFPRKGSEATPTCTRLATGVLKVVTSESTDYVFIGDAPFNFNQEGVQFTGKAGTVRVFSDYVVFCMNSGAGAIGYNGHILTGSGPFEQSVLNGNLTPGTYDLGGTPKTVRTVDLGGGVTLRGEDPFTATLDGNVLRIHTEGRARQFIVEPFPAWVVNPQFTIDGQGWLYFQSDPAQMNWGRYGRNEGYIFSTLDGSHDLELRQRVWTSPWDSGIVPTVVITQQVQTVATPIFNPVAGAFAGPQLVAISTTTSGAGIRYTTDGSTPTSTTGIFYSGPVLLSANTTLKAIAYKGGMTESVIASGDFAIATPTALGRLTANGWVEFSTTVGPGVTCEWLVSSNLVNWTSVGTNTASVAGEVVWQEGPTSHSGPRFFRVRYR